MFTADINAAINAVVNEAPIEVLRSPKKKFTYNEFLSDKLLMMAAIRAGIPYSLFEMIREFTPFNDADWAEYLELSPKSLHRYKQEGRSFKSIHSEKIIELAEVTKLGLDTFQDKDKFRHWLHTPNYALGHLQPIELLKDSYGKEMVMAALTRINHGILI